MPKVLIEVGNMRNATDAGMMISTRFQLTAPPGRHGRRRHQVR
jgi:hypothetical protein